MNPENRRKLAERVTKAAEAAFAAQKYVSPVDVLVGIGWLDPGAVKRWRQGQVDYLERVVQTNLPRISEDEAVPIMGERKGAGPERDVLCRADAAATDAALPQERKLHNRTVVLH